MPSKFATEIAEKFFPAHLGEDAEPLKAELSDLIDRELEQVVDALRPFAACADECARFRSISAENTWLWKPTATNRETAGINAANCDKAKETLLRLEQ